MRIDVNKLVESVDRIVIDELSNPELWWHQRPNLEDAYTQVSDKHPEILDRAIRHILGYLGVILEEFSFNVATKATSGTCPEFWFESQEGKYSYLPYFPHLLK